ncbi:MAG: NUDIX domain-containing protein [Patescibacteria group bacterium]
MLYNSPPAGFNPEQEIVSCFCLYLGRFLLLKRVFGDKIGAGRWGVPAGKMKKKEKALTAAIREIKEETGVKLKPVDLNYFDTVYVRYPEFDFTFHIFYTSFEAVPKIVINRKEHAEFYWAEPRESLQMDLILDEDKCVKRFFNL